MAKWLAYFQYTIHFYCLTYHLGKFTWTPLLYFNIISIYFAQLIYFVHSQKEYRQKVKKKCLKPKIINNLWSVQRSERGRDLVCTGFQRAYYFQLQYYVQDGRELFYSLRNNLWQTQKQEQECYREIFVAISIFIFFSLFPIT